MGRGWLWPQLNDDLHQLTSAQMLGKIFIGSVLIPGAENLITRGDGSSLRNSTFKNNRGVLNETDLFLFFGFSVVIRGDATQNDWH